MWGLLVWFLSMVKYLSIFGGVFYVAIALLVKIFPKIVLEGLFLNRLCPPQRFLKLDEPEKVYGLKGAKNIRVTSSSENILGVWHIPPLSADNEPLCDAKKVIIYCHGNAFHRGFYHRLNLYKELRKAGYHIVAFDYSGFGDSTGRPSVRRIVEDAKSMYKWTVEQLQNKDCVIILWGHSLGTHTSTRALSSICQNGERVPDCLILEAPFTNSIEASECYPVSKVFFTMYPYLRAKMRGTLHQCQSECPTEEYLPDISVPILIMHAEDDSRIAIQLGVKLYKKTISNPATKSRFIRFVRVHKKYAVSHYTASHPATLKLFHNFINDVLEVKGQETGNEENRFEFLDI